MSKVSSTPVNISPLAPPGRLVLSAIIGGALALAASAAVLYSALGLNVPLDVEVPFMTITIEIWHVLAVTFVSAIGATLALVGLNRILKQPFTGFTVMAAVVLLVSLIPVFRQSGAGKITALTLMHLFSAVAITWSVRRFGRA